MRPPATVQRREVPLGKLVEQTSSKPTAGRDPALPAAARSGNRRSKMLGIVAVADVCKKPSTKLHGPDPRRWQSLLLASGRNQVQQLAAFALDAEQAAIAARSSAPSCVCRLPCT
jgi:hypothetical protein